MNTINAELIAKMRENYASDQNAHTLNAAMAKTDIGQLAYIPMNAARLNGDFDIEIKTHGITAQEQSGRCWLFAAMNLTREKVIEKCNLESFELSGNYMAFWDKLEKANDFLEQIIETADRPTTDRTVDILLESPVSDGGYWLEYVDLIKKYGIVPKTAMPESRQSGYTANLLSQLKNLLRKDAAELRTMIAAGQDPSARKEEMIIEFYKAECIAFGEPVQTFDFCYRDKDNEFHADYNLTPQAFYEKYVGIDLADYVMITCMPSEKRPYHTKWEGHFHGNMIEKNLTGLNLPMDEITELILAQMKDGQPVWFGCDSRHYGEREKGYWDPKSFDYEGLLGGVSLKMSREDALAYHECCATHAMLLIGVGFDEDQKPRRWKIENSWGTDWGQKGYFVCSQEYFEEFIYEAIIDKKYLTEAQKALLDTEAVLIDPWDK